MFCSRCGSPIPEQARFCPSCGTATLAPEAAAPTAERRRLVTILFADIAGSTAMGERLDPEAVRMLLARHFAAIREVIERHGGTVEKFIGDAVMAVFGIPQTHEDDALRAVRAASEIQASIARLNADPGAVAQVAVRIGLNSGEVVAADAAADTLVTGDTVNTAARLEQAAAAGEILLGAATVDLVADAITVAPVEPIVAKGKAEPVVAHRLVAITGDEGRRRHLEAPLVGREAELALLRHAWRAVREEGEVRLVTVVAPAGIGKSRLVREIAGEAGRDGRVLTSRCLPYGDGITYWPIRSLFLGAAGVSEAAAPDTARAKLAALLGDAPDAAPVAATLAAAIGLSNEAATQDEIFWATRRGLEAIATTPLLVVIDDLHWAEPTLLDLIAYLADLAVAPILFLGTARPELLETRPEWPTLGARASVLQLEALRDGDIGALVDAQAGGAAIPGDLKRRILEAAEGNPLFVEEMVGMLRDDGRLVADGGEWAADPGRLAEVEVPTTIRALLAARLDRLPAEERVLTERASVVGRTFEAAALAELAPEALRGELGRRLVSLVRKELLRHDRADLVPGDAFRFRHVLIRDAAYEMLPKVDRAALHERFAAWLEKVTADRLPEFEEILGYHLEQAAGYRRELGDVETARRLGLQAGAHLFAAGERASRRGDNAAVIPLMTKAADLLEGPMQVEARLELAIALGGSGHYSAEVEVYEALGREPAVLADEILRTRVQVHELISGLGTPGFSGPRVRRDLQEAIPRLEAAGAIRDLAWAWLGMGLADVGNKTTGIVAFRKSIDYALACGDLRIASSAMANTSALLYFGDSPVSEALAGIDELAALTPGNPRVRAALLSSRGQLYAMVGRFEEGRAMATESRELCQQLRLTHWETSVLADRSVLELVAGNPAGAMAALDDAFALAGDLAPLHRWLEGHRVLVLAELGRHREALDIIEPMLAVDDDDVEVINRLLRAKAISLRGVGDLAGAREASDAAIDMLEQSGWVPDQAIAHLERARIRHLAGDPAWTDDVDAAEDLFGRKGHTVGLGWAAALRLEGVESS